MFQYDKYPHNHSHSNKHDQTYYTFLHSFKLDNTPYYYVYHIKIDSVAKIRTCTFATKHFCSTSLVEIRKIKFHYYILLIRAVGLRLESHMSTIWMTSSVSSK